VAGISSVRVCESCHKKTILHRAAGTSGSTERINVGGSQLTVPNARRSPSQISDFAKYSHLVFMRKQDLILFPSCPVCERALNGLGTAVDQEAHVRNCLEGGGGLNAQMSRYVNYKLPAGSVKIGSECKQSLIQQNYPLEML
jgi:hypothetical protein